MCLGLENIDLPSLLDCVVKKNQKFGCSNFHVNLCSNMLLTFISIHNSESLISTFGCKIDKED